MDLFCWIKSEYSNFCLSLLGRATIWGRGFVNIFSESSLCLQGSCSTTVTKFLLQVATFLCHSLSLFSPLSRRIPSPQWRSRLPDLSAFSSRCLSGFSQLKKVFFSKYQIPWHWKGQNSKSFKILSRGRRVGTKPSKPFSPSHSRQKLLTFRPRLHPGGGVDGVAVEAVPGVWSWRNDQPGGMHDGSFPSYITGIG